MLQLKYEAAGSKIKGKAVIWPSRVPEVEGE